MTRENKEILFEGRDTHNRQVLVFGIWLFAAMGITALLMIPLVGYLNNLVTDHRVTPIARTATPEVVLEVHPSQELKKMAHENESIHADKKIHEATNEILADGFPVR